MSIEKNVPTKALSKPEVLICGWLRDTFKENHRLSDNTVIFESRIQTVDFWDSLGITKAVAEIIVDNFKVYQ